MNGSLAHRWWAAVAALWLLWGGPARAQDDEPVWVIEPEDTLVTPPGTDDSAEPPATFVRMTITTTDSVRIGAWFFPPQDGYGNVLTGRQPGVVIVPREGQTLPDRGALASALADRGFAVLTFDQRGEGRSDPFDVDPHALIHPKYLKDVHAALDILQNMPEVDTTRVAVMGESRGAYLALAAVADRPEVRAVVSVSVAKSWKALQKTLERYRPGEEFVVPTGWRREYDPERVLARFNGSVLFIVGDMDLLTPAWMSRELYDDYVRRKDYWEVSGATHDVERNVEAVMGEDFYDRVAKFLRDELNRPPHRGWPHR